LEAIQSLIDNGEQQVARQQLKTVLKTNPSAQAWYLSALVADDPNQQIKCLRQALKLDEFHTPSNRLLYKIEGGMPQAEREKRKRREEMLKTREITPLEKIDRQKKQDRFQKHRARQKARTRLGCLFSLLLSVSCSMFAASVVGMFPGFIGTITTIIGGPQPVYEIDGTPIEQRDDALEIMTPAQSNPASNQDVEIMDHGYLHEYVFSARQGKTYAAYVQFMSLNANHVSRNVAIVDEQGYDVTASCEREHILDGDMGIAYICEAHSSGRWAVRILGINGESVGAYFVGVEALDF